MGHEESFSLVCVFSDEFYHFEPIFEVENHFGITREFLDCAPFFHLRLHPRVGKFLRFRVGHLAHLFS